MLLGFEDELGLLGLLVESLEVELPVELAPVPMLCEPPVDPLMPLPWPFPVTVMLSSTLRLPA